MKVYLHASETAFLLSQIYLVGGLVMLFIELDNFIGIVVVTVILSLLSWVLFLIAQHKESKLKGGIE